MKGKTYKSKVIYALTCRPCENFLQEAEMAQLIAEEQTFGDNEKQEKNPNLFFLPEIFVGSLFPRAQIESNIWVADRPLHTLRISSPYEVPYGSLPRLLLAYIINAPSALAFLGNSRRRFKNILECDLTDREFDRQIRNLFFHTLIDIEVVWGGSGFVGTDSCLLIIGARDPSWRNYQDLSSTKWKKELQIHPLFFKFVINAKQVAFNFHSYLSLSDSPLAMDLYIWLCREWSALQEKGKSENSYTLQLLQEVFGCEEKSDSEFKDVLINCFHKVLPHFPGFQNNAKLFDDGEHLVLTKPKKSVLDVLNKF